MHCVSELHDELALGTQSLFKRNVCSKLFSRDHMENEVILLLAALNIWQLGSLKNETHLFY